MPMPRRAARHSSGLVAFVGWAAIAATLPAAGCGAPEGGQALPQTPAPHPHLADSPWPISHANTWAQAAATPPAHPAGTELPDSPRADFVETGFVSITLAMSDVYPDGGRVAWGSSFTRIFKLDATAQTPALLAELLRAEQPSSLIAGAYTLLDEHGVFWSTRDGTIEAHTDADPDDRTSGIVNVGSWSLPDAAEKEVIVGLAMTWDGHLAFATSTGRIGVIDRALQQPVFGPSLGEEISNSIAVDEDGGIFVVGSQSIARAVWTGSEVTLDAALGAWKVPYEAGDGTIKPGRLGPGSGSTPSLMGGARDGLVVITDGRDVMHLVAFWRGDIPADWEGLGEGMDRRVAASVPVTFGDPTRETSLSEQSVLVDGWRAAVVSNTYGDYDTPLEPVLAGIAPPGIEQFEWDPEARTLQTSWTIPDVSCPNGIPAMNRKTQRMHCIGRRGETWTLESIDWNTGAVDTYVELGIEDRYNSVYAATEIGQGGDVWSGTLTGAVRVRSAKLAASPE
jgi:hypothetical protein